MPFVPCSGKHRSSPIVDTADTFSAKKETFKFCYLTRLNMRKAARLTEGMNDWLNDKPTVRLTDKLSVWVEERVSE